MILWATTLVPAVGERTNPRRMHNRAHGADIDHGTLSLNQQRHKGLGNAQYSPKVNVENPLALIHIDVGERGCVPGTGIVDQEVEFAVCLRRDGLHRLIDGNWRGDIEEKGWTLGREVRALSMRDGSRAVAKVCRPWLAKLAARAAPIEPAEVPVINTDCDMAVGAKNVKEGAVCQNACGIDYKVDAGFQVCGTASESKRESGDLRLGPYTGVLDVTIYLRISSCSH